MLLLMADQRSGLSDSPSHTVMGKSSALGVRDRVPFVALLQIAPLVALERMSADDFGTFLSA